MKNWIVILDEKPEGPFPYSDEYFPRGFHYKTDASMLKISIEIHGGKARVVPAKEFDGAVKSGEKSEEKRLS